MPTTIDRYGVRRLVAEGAQLVEVLPPKDYEDEHLPDAINLPLKQLDRKTTTILDRNQPVIVYCYDNQGDLTKLLRTFRFCPHTYRAAVWCSRQHILALRQF
jgi:Rhodanese-like domain